MESIYGAAAPLLPLVLEEFLEKLKEAQTEYKKKTGFKICEHLDARIKDEDSMREKCHRKGVEESPEGALRQLYDSIGIRVITGFRDDIYVNVELLRNMEGVSIIEEKDYVHHAKENGYRSYHIILEYISSYPDIMGGYPGRYYIEVQIRTIAMDSWAALEHQLKYKKEMKGNVALIQSELKRVADELASCDVNMQTIRGLIRHENEKNEG